MRLVQVLYRLLDQATWDECNELDPDFLAALLAQVSLPFGSQGASNKELGLVRDPAETIPDFKDHRQFFWHFTETPCCDLFKTVLGNAHLNEHGYAAAMDILSSYQKKAKVRL